MIPASVSLYVTQVSCAKMAELIDMQFALETLGDPRSIALDGGPNPSKAREREVDAACRKYALNTVMSNDYNLISLRVLSTEMT